MVWACAVALGLFSGKQLGSSVIGLCVCVRIYLFLLGRVLQRICLWAALTLSLQVHAQLIRPSIWHTIRAADLGTAETRSLSDLQLFKLVTVHVLWTLGIIRAHFMPDNQLPALFMSVLSWHVLHPSSASDHISRDTVYASILNHTPAVANTCIHFKYRTTAQLSGTCTSLEYFLFLLLCTSLHFRGNIGHFTPLPWSD